MGECIYIKDNDQWVSRCVVYSTRAALTNEPITLVVSPAE